MWLSGRMRKGFAMTGLVVAAVFAYLAMASYWYDQGRLRHFGMKSAPMIGAHTGQLRSEMNVG
jgi:hypothetical protein